MVENPQTEVCRSDVNWQGGLIIKTRTFQPRWIKNAKRLWKSTTTFVNLYVSVYTAAFSLVGRSLHQLHHGTVRTECDSGMPLPRPGNKHSRATAIRSMRQPSHQMERSLDPLHIIRPCDSGMPLPGPGNRRSKPTEPLHLSFSAVPKRL